MVVKQLFPIIGQGPTFSPDVCGRCTGDCGDSIEVYLVTGNGEISQVAYRTNGCRSTELAASTLMKLIRGRSIEEAGRFTALDVIARSEGLDEDHEHCAVIAVNALQEALGVLRRARRPVERAAEGDPPAGLMRVEPGRNEDR